MDYKSPPKHSLGVSALFNQSQQNLAQKVKAARLRKGLSQESLALEAGIDRTYASQIERGIGNPSLKIICALAEVLGVDLVDLLS